MPKKARPTPRHPEPPIIAQIQYRLQCIEIMEHVLRHPDIWHSKGTIALRAGDAAVTHVSLTAVRNAMIEIGAIHSRALLEFLGLKVKEGGKLIATSRETSPIDDIHVEDFLSASGTPLAAVLPETALSHYPADRSVAESALAALVSVANKGIAHVTSVVNYGIESEEQLSFAARGVIALTTAYFLNPRGIERDRSITVPPQNAGATDA